MKLRVLSYNIHKCIGGIDRKYDPSRICEVVSKLEPDIVMMQEVDAGVKRSNGDHQAELLAEALGLKYHTWFPNVEIKGGGQYGNAILSRYPIIESANIDLTTKWKKKRSVVHGVVRVRHDDLDRTVHVYNMHLGLAGYERKQQIDKFLASQPFQQLHDNTPVVVGGDLNDVYGGLGELLEPAGFRGTEKRPRTFPAWGPLRALDAIFVRGELDYLGLERCDSQLARRASDHRPLVAEVRLRAHRYETTQAPPPTPRP